MLRNLYEEIPNFSTQGKFTVVKDFRNGYFSHISDKTDPIKVEDLESEEIKEFLSEFENYKEKIKDRLSGSHYWFQFDKSTDRLLFGKPEKFERIQLYRETLEKYIKCGNIQIQRGFGDDVGDAGEGPKLSEKSLEEPRTFGMTVIVGAEIFDTGVEKLKELVDIQTTDLKLVFPNLETLSIFEGSLICVNEILASLENLKTLIITVKNPQIGKFISYLHSIPPDLQEIFQNILSNSDFTSDIKII